MRRTLFPFLLLLGVMISSDRALTRTFIFDEPVDAVSIGFESDAVDLSIQKNDNWEALEIEKEFDPLLRESNLILLPKSTSMIRLRGRTTAYQVHPLRISDEPAHYAVAARTSTVRPTVLSREQWGADESLLTNAPQTTRSDVSVVRADDSTPSRVRECQDKQRKYPDEFKTTDTTTTNEKGELLSWPQRHSPEIKLLVVHHTAMAITGDERTPVERMRALYEYHARSRGWGDVGYNYIIDEYGQIYEGRAGGDYVVGGHAYCANVGTIGIALMGNFELEQPTQDQMTGLRWLLNTLARKYSINVRSDVTYHGEKLAPLVGHGDLVQTTCPGFYINETLGQIRSDVLAGRFYSPIKFPTMSFYRDGTLARKTARIIRAARTVKLEPSLKPIGSTDFTARPGGEVKFQMRYQAGEAAVSKRARLAEVERSYPRIGVWQELGGRSIRVREELLSPVDLNPGETHVIQLRVLFPSQARGYELKIGDTTYKLRAEGRGLTRSNNVPSLQKYQTTINPDTPLLVRAHTQTPSNIVPSQAVQEKVYKIRIKLGYEADKATITTNTLAGINGKYIGTRSIALEKVGESCVAIASGLRIASGIIRIDPGSGVSTISNWERQANRFRGDIECRVIDGKMVLINEISLENYIAGLAEEPDSEPYEKQRAFAIAARSYAAYYIDPAHRKFPGMPYDGSDSPAEFQAYGGVQFEWKNPRWVEAAKSTKGIVVSKDGQVVKTPYFSSDDGRTRSPKERGWGGFPFAEVFSSKPDPWCEGMPMNGHGVGMSGCGAEGQANKGYKAETILNYYYTGTKLVDLDSLGS